MGWVLPGVSKALWFSETSGITHPKTHSKKTWALNFIFILFYFIIIIFFIIYLFFSPPEQNDQTFVASI